MPDMQVPCAYVEMGEGGIKGKASRVQKQTCEGESSAVGRPIPGRNGEDNVHQRTRGQEGRMGEVKRGLQIHQLGSLCS